MIKEIVNNNVSLFDHEQAAINQIKNVVRKYNARLLSNILLYDKQTHNYYEYDIIIIASSGIYVVELKHWTGNIHIEQYNWIVNQSYRPDPHKNNNFKCKILKGIYQHTFKTYPDIWIPSFVVLTNPNSVVEGADIPSRLSVDMNKKMITFSSITDFIKFFRKKESTIENIILKPSQIESIFYYFSSLNKPRRGIKYTIPGYETVEYLYQRPECIELIARPIGIQSKGLNRFRVFRIPYQITTEEKERYEKKAYNTLSAVSLIGDHPYVHKVWIVENETGDIIEGSNWSESGTLRDYINDKQKKISIDQTLRICRNILSALVSAHEASVIHRAVKPENILMMNEIPKLMNFDLSYQISDEKHVTVIDNVGKLHDDGYIAPEIFTGNDIDEGTDFFSLGVILYEMLIGSKPFRSTREFIAKGGGLSDECQKNLKRTDLPQKTISVILGMIVLDRNKRLKNPQIILSGLDTKNVISDDGIRTPVINPILKSGSTYDIYEIIEFIGKGRDAQVYKSKALKEKYIALKLFNREVQLDRILKEADIISTVKSSYIVHSDNKVGHWNNERFFIVMDYIDGESLRIRIDRNERPDIDTFKSISLSLMSAVEALHENCDEDGNTRTILHSDIKPENILISSDKKPVLIDFGIAGKPRVDVFSGTEGYVPPDSIIGSEMQFSKDGDLFALGVTLWEWVYGRRPYTNPAIGDFPEEINGVLPSAIHAWLMKSVATKSSERFSDIGEMKAAFINSLREFEKKLYENNKNDKLYKHKEIEQLHSVRESNILSEENERLQIEFESKKQSCENSFVSYLNTFACSSASNPNAIAESQFGNPNFDLLHVENPITELIYKMLLNKHRNIILTGNAGDGKTTIAAEIFYKFTGEMRALRKKENINFNNIVITIIKDMSELSEEQRISILNEAFHERERKYLIISNTGMLLESFSKLQVDDEDTSNIESELLKALQASEPKRVLKEQFMIFNIGNTDSIDLACEVFKRMISKENWDICCLCGHNDKCNIFTNVQLIQENLNLVCERIMLLYRRLYEYGIRLTIRQMTEHLAYSLTSGLNCNELKLMSNTALVENLYNSLFYNRFFGDDSIDIIPEAMQLLPIEKINADELGTIIDPLFEREVWTNTNAGRSLTGKASNIFWDLKAKAELPDISVRRQIRRLIYFFGNLNSEDGKRYISNFLNSPMIQSYFEIAYRMDNIPPLFESRYRQKILHVLQEYFIGIRLPEGGEAIRDLYITLNRRDSKSTTQMVLADFRIDNFEIISKNRYETENSSIDCRKLYLICKLGDAEMELDLPFLDFVERRYEGEVAEQLSAYYNDRLERFKVKLLGIYGKNASNNDNQLQLLRIDTARKYKLKKVIISDNKLEVI